MKSVQISFSKIMKLVGLAIFLVAMGIYGVLSVSGKQPRLDLSDALYVTDKDTTKVYGPGSKVQQSVLAQISTQEGIVEMKFTQPFLYRMGLDAGEANERILLMSFSPAHPDMAKLLRRR